MKFLIDHNLEGHAIILFGSLGNQGWLDLVSIRFVNFAEIGLSVKSSDRVVWRFAQEKRSPFLNS
ncbi:MULTISPECIES: hypothetical protein [Spirulina sp. CCY15215]|uniref:hypothetical protein n=1 Tax=Spirulina sp. CCY15215 TaxID=2767591 RepID=UPI00194EF6E8|nr:hypothetical protein [Spirulina major]